ncbi:MAG TPA: FAD:protein FMN transferase [Trebonia sp.]|nr:FAD:protein FMN transferase [Trebonia sp.]
MLSSFPLLPAPVPVTARVRRAEPVMGTVVSFDVPAAAVADGSLDAAVRWLHWVDRVFSPYRPDSDVSLLAAAEVTVDGCAPEVAEVISACTAVRLCSGGYFTAAPGGVFDPSGYVKGWAVERAAAILSAAGSSNHLVNGGGDVQCAGGRPRSSLAPAPVPDSPAPAGPPSPAPGEEPWRVGIADPLRRGRLALVVEAADSAVATSGIAERGAHIVDPHLGRPAAGLASLTVVGPSLALADAYATAAFAMGPARARDWTESLPDYEAYAITEDGDTWQTPGFAPHIAPA